MPLSSAAVERQLYKIDSLVVGSSDKVRNFEDAYLAVRFLLDYALENPAVWLKYIEACYLTNRRIEASNAEKTAAQYCKGWGEFEQGVAALNHASSLLRTRSPGSAAQYFTIASRLLTGRTERLFDLYMVRGQLDYVMGQLEGAAEHFSFASRATDHPAARLTVSRWLLKVFVTARGIEIPQVQALSSALSQGFSTFGSPDLLARLEVIMQYGQDGNKWDDQLEFSATPPVKPAYIKALAARALA